MIEEYEDEWCLVQRVGRTDQRGVIPRFCLIERQEIIPRTRGSGPPMGPFRKNLHVPQVTSHTPETPNPPVNYIYLLRHPYLPLFAALLLVNVSLHYYRSMMSIQLTMAEWIPGIYLCAFELLSLTFVL
jgi:hypothetical protein